MTTHYITFGYWCITSWCHLWKHFFCWNNVNFKGDKIPFKTVMINKILHSWLFNIKLTKILLINFICMTTRVRSFICFTDVTWPLFWSSSTKLTKWLFDPYRTTICCRWIQLWKEDGFYSLWTWISQDIAQAFVKVTVYCTLLVKDHVSF